MTSSSLIAPDQLARLMDDNGTVDAGASVGPRGDTGDVPTESAPAQIQEPIQAGRRDARVVIADVRFYLADHAQGRQEYQAGHVPGAVFVDLHHDLADTSIANAGRHPLPTTTAFGQLLSRLGIAPETLVVAYDDHGGAMAARLWWMLRSVGHSDVRVLDGGYRAWVEAGLPVETTTDESGSRDSASSPIGATAYPVPDQWVGIVDAPTIGDDPQRGFAVVDSRAPQRYRGEVEPHDPRAGHIPGAVNRFHADVVGPDRRFLASDQLAAHFHGLGDSPVFYCGSGVTACHNLLAMSVAGNEGALLYPGSWSEWSASAERAIESDDRQAPSER